MASDDERPPSTEPVVLGVELAAASAIEEFRLQEHSGDSPLADMAYDRGAAFVESPRFRSETLDGELRFVVGQWAQLSPEELGALRSMLSMDDFSTLMTFARRSVVLGLRSDDPAWPLGALHGLTGVASERVDFRDLTMAAALVAYALDALGGDTSATMERAATRSDMGTAEILRRFAAEPPPSLADWGYAVAGDGVEISLVRADFERYAPTVDLLSTARGIAAAIDGDRYETESITLATRLPPVWLRGGDDETRASRAVGSARGCANIRAQPRPAQWRSTEGLGSHMFVVFLTELTTARKAELVAGAAASSTGDHARLAVARGRVAAVLISRSVVVGVDGLETDESLQRFGTAFTAALS